MEPSVSTSVSLLPCWYENRAISRNGSIMAYYNIHKVGKKNDDSFKN